MNEIIKEIATDVGLDVNYLIQTKQWCLIEELIQRVIPASHKQIQSLNAVVRAQQITIQKLEDQAEQERSSVKQEPVAWMYDRAKYPPNDLRGQQWAPALGFLEPYTGNGMAKNVRPLYTTPPAAPVCERVTLTDDEKSCGNCKHLNKSICIGCHDGIHNRWEPSSVRERNFCERCGKRLGGEGHIHTCTPPAN